MKTRLAVAFALVATAAAAGPADEFARYRGAARLDRAPAAPQMKLAKARQFKTVLGEAAAQGPNFNGRFRTVSWGCGSNCMDWAVIDLANGEVWFPAEPAESCRPGTEADEAALPERIVGKVESRLLYVHSCSHAEPQTRSLDRRSVYEWKDGALVLLRREPLPPRPR